MAGQAETDAAPLVQRFKGMTAHAPQERMWPELRKILESFAATRPAQGDDGQWTTSAREMACLLYVKALRAPNPELEDIYFQGLAGCGPLGALCMAQLLRRRILAPETDAKPPDPAALLARVPQSVLPEVQNDLLLCPALDPPALTQAAARLLEQRPLDGPAMSRLLCSLAGNPGAVAYALEDGWMQGEFGPSPLGVVEAQIANVAGGLRPDEALYPLLEALAALQRPELSDAVAPLLAVRYLPALLGVLTAMRCLGVSHDIRLAKLVSKLLMHPECRVQLAAMNLLMLLAPKDLGRLLAALFRKNQNLRGPILARLPLLDRAEFEAFLAALPAQAASALLPDLLAAVAALDPTTARECLAAAARPGNDDQARTELEALIPQRVVPPEFDPDLAVKEFEKSLPKKKPDKAGKKQEKSSLFSRFGGGSNDEAISVQFGLTAAPAESDASGRKLSAPIHDGQPLQRLKFNKTFLDAAVFQNCTLSEVDFSDSLLRGARFENCVMEGCDFSRARLYDCDFYDVRLAGCVFAEALFSSCRATLADVAGSDLHGARLHSCALKTCRFSASDLGRIRFTRTGLAGVELLHCLLPDAVFEDSAGIHCTVAACRTANCRVEGLLTDTAVFMALEERWLCDRAMDAEPPDLGGKDMSRKVPAPALELARATLGNWYRRRDMRAMERAFTANNARRVSWCMEKMGPEKSEFFRLAPFLIHSTVFEDNNDEVPALPLSMRLSVYQPDYTTMEAARKHFPNAILPKPEPDPVRIEALYTIGSVGTIAQTVKSDLDYWVCYDPEDMPEIMVDGLTYKLEHIEKWADERFGLEVHFFTMDKTLIQDNNFGVSDQESSGTAQAMLLKEEFYRTAVAVAGKTPAWWLTQVGTSDQDYAAGLAFVAHTRDKDRIIDLGNMVDIPHAEFFGASLWQIVKALKSPFKSIMKFGLLEKYIAAGKGGGSRLLCDQLKLNLRHGRTSLLYADPYTLLFREVSNYYRLAKNKESLQLVRLSFVLKTKVNQQCFTGRIAPRRELREIDSLFMPRDGAPALCSRDTMAGDDWPFDRLVSVGGLVNKFIVRTYMRVRDSQAGDKDVAIAPEDLTKLGRKISSSFSRRRHKIEHIPFVSMGAGNFRVLHFSAFGKKMGSPSEWDCKGAQQVSTSQHRLHLADLRQGKDLAQMLIWLAVNGLYNPAMQVKGDYSISPVTAKDIQNLMDRFLQFFPSSSTFNTDIGETLNPERIVKAFFVLNLVKPRELDRLQEASIIYCTNWGELFCQTMAVSGDTMISNPVEFLLQNVEQEFSEPPQMNYFVPERSMCPRPRLSK